MMKDNDDLTVDEMIDNEIYLYMMSIMNLLILFCV